MTPSVTFWGAGTFANALASCIAPDIKIVMWGRSEHSFRSPSFRVTTTRCVVEAAQSDVWIFCVPAQALRACLTHIQSINVDKIPLICMVTCKGIERSSGSLMPEVLREFFPEVPEAVIAGPNFALELTQGSLSGLTIGTKTVENFVLAAALFQTSQLHIQHVPCLDALSAWGALKNVSALGCGIVWEITKSHNTLCMFITQAFVQSKAWIKACVESDAAAAMLSYGGLGDFVMSCTSTSSRNFRYGASLVAQDKKVGSDLVEGVESLYGVLERSAQHHVDLSFATQLERLLSQPSVSTEWLNQLMSY